MEEEELEIKTKICTRCKEEKEISEFYKEKRRENKPRSQCKKCVGQYHIENREKILKQKKEHYEKNKEKILEYGKQYRKENKEKLKEKDKQYYENNREKIKEQIKQYRKENKEKLKEKDKQYYENNREKILKQKKEYYEKNKEKIQKYQNKREREKYKNDIDFKLKKTLKRQIYKNIHKQGTTFGRYITEYTPEDLKKHLESQFDDKMSWENHGKYWHIDHIIPVSFYDFVNENGSENLDQIKLCWSLGNLQPLEAKENLLKSNKIPVMGIPAIKLDY